MPASRFDRPPLSHILLHPIHSILPLLSYAVHTALRPSSSATAASPRLNITLVCLSDTHTHTLPATRIPHGDVLIHAGDLANAGDIPEIQAQLDWLAQLPHRYKIVIAGNHDSWLDPRSREVLRRRQLQDLQRDPAPAQLANGPNAQVDDKLNWHDIIYLQDGTARLDFANRLPGSGQLVVYGSPHIPACGGEDFAFQYARTKLASQETWTNTVPADVDVLVTHTPPKFRLDLAGWSALGDLTLLGEVRLTKPRVHVFGHVHAGKSDLLGWWSGGQEVVRWDASEKWFEKAMTRGQEERSLVGRALDVLGWWYLINFLFYGLSGLLQEWAGMGEAPASTRFVNAALMYRDSGRILNPPQVVHI